MREFDKGVMESSAGCLRLLVGLVLVAIFFGTGASSTALAILIMVYAAYCFIASI